MYAIRHDRAIARFATNRSMIATTTKTAAYPAAWQVKLGQSEVELVAEFAQIPSRIAHVMG